MTGGGAPGLQRQPMAGVFDDIAQLFTHERGVFK
jgi:hypothetical protein